MTTDKALVDAIIDLCWKATPTGATTDGDVSAYILPKGVVHRLIGAAQCAGIPAAFRVVACPAPEDSDPSHLDSTCWKCGKYGCDCP